MHSLLLPWAAKVTVSFFLSFGNEVVLFKIHNPRTFGASKDKAFTIEWLPVKRNITTH